MASVSRRKFSPQFKAEAVQLVVQSGRPIVKVAGELAINPGTLGNWENKYRAEHGSDEKPEMSPADHAWLAELEEEVRRLRMESEFLKSRGLLREGAGLSEKADLIEAEKDNYPIAWMCQQLQVSRSSFYASGRGTRTGRV